MQKKTCLHCKQPIFSKKLCKFHHKLEFPKKYQLKSKKKFGYFGNKIKPISDKHKERLEQYFRMREEYFSEHPVCEFPGCSSKDIQLHHKSGRIGENLFKDFCSLCFIHHRWVEDNPEQAKLLNLSNNRL